MMTNLWDQLALTKSIKLQAFAPYIARREKQRLIQFLMALCSDFEALRETTPFIESVVSELLVEDRYTSKSQAEKCISTSHTFVLVVPFGPPSKPPSRPTSNNHNKPYSRVATDECSYCKQ